MCVKELLVVVPRVSITIDSFGEIFQRRTHKRTFQLLQSPELVHVCGLVETNGTSEPSVAATCRSIHVRGESTKPNEEEEVCSKYTTTTTITTTRSALMKRRHLQFDPSSAEDHDSQGNSDPQDWSALFVFSAIMLVALLWV